MQPRNLIHSSSFSNIFEASVRLEELVSALIKFLENQRWFAAKTAGIRSVEILDSVQIPGKQTTFELILATVVTNDGLTDCYALPVTIVEAESVVADESIIASLADESRKASTSNLLAECSGNPEFWRAITTTLANGVLTTRNGRELQLSRTANSRFNSDAVFRSSDFRIHDGEQSNSAVAIGDDLFLKLFRRPRVGQNPDAEIGIFLTDQTDFQHSPQVEATINIVGDDGTRCLALISEQVNGAIHAWVYTLRNLEDFWERLAKLDDRPDFPPRFDLLNGDGIENLLSTIGSLNEALIGKFAGDAALLGKRTAELHTELASSDDDPAFAPEPLTKESLDVLIGQIRHEVQTTCELLEQADLTEISMANLPQKISLRTNARLDAISSIDTRGENVVNIRCHGDYHLGQVLKTESDFVILDFEGEPDRPFDERRQKRCAIKDVAGMIRSLHYASCTTAVGMLPSPDASIANIESWQRYWYESARDCLLVGYEQEASGGNFFPTDSTVFQQLLELFLIEKVLYELRYEINNRPDWVQIPLAGLNAVLGLSDNDGH
jgi:trehalose synthase-fused probable maltokinase